MSKKVKVLYFVDRLLRGGIQSFIIDYVSHMDFNKVQIDILVLDDGHNYELEDKLQKSGVHLYKLQNIWLRKPADFPKYLKALDCFFAKHHDYDIIHMHSSSKNVFVLQKAKKYGIPVRIAHAHNTKFQSQNKTKQILGDILKLPLRKAATHYFACSNAAGQWMFGKKLFESGRIQIISNAIKVDDFVFHQETREKMRKSLGIEHSFVIGCVGRFAPQKNHLFLIDVFCKIHTTNADAVLLLVGDGELRPQIEQKIKDLKLENSVILAGFRNNVNDFLQAMDVFVMPSLYEGLGIVLIEAQASGLPCVVSDIVPKEAIITDLVESVSLKENVATWADYILQLQHGFKRKDMSQQIKAAGYDIDDSAKKLQEFYMKHC